MTTNENHLIKTDHASSIISKLSSYVRQGFLCDIIFICQKRRLSAHRLIISTLSDYFQRLFENNKQTEIDFNDIDADIFEKFIIYAYEGKYLIEQKKNSNDIYALFFVCFLLGHLDIQLNNVNSILSTALMFNIEEIIETCCQFIKKQLQISNCLSFHRFAIKHDLQELTQIIWFFVLVCRYYNFSNRYFRCIKLYSGSFLGNYRE